MITGVVGSPYYVAPEVLTEEYYDEKCDIWSIGVILYMMLSGRPPFEGKCDLEIVKNAKLGIYNVNIPEMDHVSDEGKDLIEKLMTFNPRERISADQALYHDWIKKFDNKEADQIIVNQCLQALAKYNASDQLQEAVIIFIVGQLANKEDMVDLQKAFNVIDTNNDGMISKAELLVGFTNMYKDDEDKAYKEVKEIFDKVDIDCSGFIDYKEWVVGTINKNKLLTREKL